MEDETFATRSTLISISSIVSIVSLFTPWIVMIAHIVQRYEIVFLFGHVIFQGEAISFFEDWAPLIVALPLRLFFVLILVSHYRGGTNLKNLIFLGIIIELPLPLLLTLSLYRTTLFIPMPFPLLVALILLKIQPPNRDYI